MLINTRHIVAAFVQLHKIITDMSIKLLFFLILKVPNRHKKRVILTSASEKKLLNVKRRL